MMECHRNEDIIDIRQVTAYCGSTCVFRDFSLAVQEGCSTVILGPNGSGKTTLMKLISRDIYPVAEPDSSVRIFGKERWNVWDLRTRLGIVSHELQHNYLSGARGTNVILSGLYASIDTWQNQHFSGDDCQKAEEVMERLGIGALKNRAFGAMSTGQQRRFLLGRALINDPDALLLDEPTTGLDLRATFQYLETLRLLMRFGKTVMLVTHHLHEIPPEIERVVLLKEGRIVSDGKKSDVLTSVSLSDLFDYPLQVVAVNGYYQVLPAV
ncbi:MAG: ATP-binding cassette domain-containing protein [Chlorobiales bacterium]|nr:ATP-binding cassette domain-containing protein [Chlorobiales bacterium]